MSQPWSLHRGPVVERRRQGLESLAGSGLLAPLRCYSCNSDSSPRFSQRSAAQSVLSAHRRRASSKRWFGSLGATLGLASREPLAPPRDVLEPEAK